MRKTLAAILISASLGLSLGGCAALNNAWTIATGASVTPEQAVIAANAYDAVAVTAKNYLLLPLCSTTASKVCRTQANSAALYQAILIGRSARNALVAAINSTGTPIAISLYTAVQAQTATLQQITSTYNIGG
jgi:hypothetical protein